MRARLVTCLAALAAVLAGCFQTDAVLTVRPDGSAQLVETTRAEGYAGALLLRTGVVAPEDAVSHAAVQGAGVRLDTMLQTAEPGALTRTLVYEIDDVAALRYRLGRTEALESMSGSSIAAAFSPTGLPPRPPSAEEIAETTIRFGRDGDSLRVVVPERAIATRDVWGPDIETHGPGTAGSVAIRFAVRAERSGARLTVADLDVSRLFETLPPRPGAFPLEDPTLTEPLDDAMAAYERQRAAYRGALQALADSAVGGIDRPGLQIAPSGPHALAL